MLTILTTETINKKNGFTVSKTYLLFVLFLTCWACTDDDDPFVPEETKEYTYIFWASAGDRTIERAIFDGDSLVERTVIYQGEWESAPSEVVVDPDKQLVYWSDFETQQILSISWDGQGPADTLYSVSSAGGGPIGLAIDASGRQLYWTKPYEDLIMRAPADGSGPVDTLFTSDDGINGAWGIGISLAAGYLYWVEYRDAQVYRVPVGLTEAPDLVYAGGSGFLRPYGLAVSDDSNDLFIVDNPLPGAGKSDRIYRGTADGSTGLQAIYTDGEVSNAYNMVFLPDDDAVYWLNQLNSGSIYRGNMDGTAPATVLIDDINIGEGLAVVKINEGMNE